MIKLEVQPDPDAIDNLNQRQRVIWVIRQNGSRCFLWCTSRANFVVYSLLHSLHLNSPTLVCSRLCRLRFLLVVNCIWHVSHANGFTLVWLSICFTNSNCVENMRRQTLHGKTFRPVCLIIWTCKSWTIFKSSPHLHK